MDSSLTRVQPVFNELYDKEKTGETWLARLLQLPQHTRTSIIPENLGYLDQPPVFELPADPPRRFLRWLLEHREGLCCPNQGIQKKWSKRTQQKRQALLRGDELVCEEAIAELEGSDRLPGRAWWRLEGVTRVDCAITTPTTAIFVEGKRTEMGASKAVEWYPCRNQVLRNLDCASVFAEQTKRQQFFVLLVVEGKIVDQDPVRQAEIKSITSPDTIRTSLPHLNDDERRDLLAHYLGVTTWEHIADTFALSSLRL
ncbi:MAG: hypothetical protein HY675_29090 [Chloroflexi bacterium]|nr:hypothetical protein [Chloroflexota bacterium]